MSCKCFLSWLTNPADMLPSSWIYSAACFKDSLLNLQPLTSCLHPFPLKSVNLSFLRSILTLPLGSRMTFFCPVTAMLCWLHFFPFLILQIHSTCYFNFSILFSYLLIFSSQNPLLGPVSCWTGARGRQKDTGTSVWRTWPCRGRAAWRCAPSFTDTDPISCE